MYTPDDGEPGPKHVVLSIINRLISAIQLTRSRISVLCNVIKTSKAGENISPSEG